VYTSAASRKVSANDYEFDDHDELSGKIDACLREYIVMA